MDNDTGIEYLFKFVVTGDSGVGKTNLISRFRRGEFNPETRATIGIEFAPWATTINGDAIKTSIWDTAGQERYGSILTPAFYRGAAGAMIVYDITDRTSFQNVSRWLKVLREGCSSPDLVIILVGNKSDLEAARAVSTDEAQAYATEHGFFFTEASALDSSNVASAFEETLEEIHRLQSRHHQLPPFKNADSIAINSVNEKTTWSVRGRCC